MPRDVMGDVIFDLDDFAESMDRNCMLSLLRLKEKFPNFKCTLFAIPNYENKIQQSFFQMTVDDFDWIQLAVHGWTHSSNFECKEWSTMEAFWKIKIAEDMGCFVKGFKAPGWQISRETYNALNSLGFWVADHHESVYTEPGVLNKDRRPPGLKAYEIDHPWMVHGHTWNCVGNGIQELIEKWEKEGYPFDENTRFHFIDDYIKELP